MEIITSGDGDADDDGDDFYWGCQKLMSSQCYFTLDDHNLCTYAMTPGFKPFTE